MHRQYNATWVVRVRDQGNVIETGNVIDRNVQGQGKGIDQDHQRNHRSREDHAQDREKRKGINV